MANKKLKVLELFSGSAVLSNTFKKNGHQTFTIDNNESLKCSLHKDISKLTLRDVIKNFAIPDVVWIGTDCTTYSLAGIHWHRKKVNGKLVAISDYAKFCDKMNKHVKVLVGELKKLNPKLLFFWENPLGAFRKMDFIQDIPRYTITYCKYGDKRMKPTDIFTNHPNPCFKPPCHYGDSCHEAAPRGTKSGTQALCKEDRSKYPAKLCKHIVRICEDYYNNKKINGEKNKKAY